MTPRHGRCDVHEVADLGVSSPAAQARTAPIMADKTKIWNKGTKKIVWFQFRLSRARVSCHNFRSNAMLIVESQQRGAKIFCG